MEDRTPVQLAALLAGASFLLVGILGFVPGPTTDYAQLSLASHHSEASVLIDQDSAANFVPLDGADNLLHLGLGMVAGRARAREASFREFLGGFSRSLTRWPPHVRDRHGGHVVQEPELHHSSHPLAGSPSFHRRRRSSPSAPARR